MLQRVFVVLAAALLVTSPAIAGADETAPGLIANGRVDEAIAALRGQISASPNDALAHNLLCRAYFSLAEWDRGISACEKAVALAPQNSQFHLWLGRIYGEKADKSGFMTAAGLARRVRGEFETAVQLNPNSVDARIAEKKKDFATAEKEYRAAIEASHGSASSWLNLALFYRHRERSDEMEQALGHVRGAALDRSDALVDAAEILIRSQRNLQEAVQLLRAYLDSGSKVEQAPAFKVHYLLGTAVEKLGDKQNAASEYRSALSLAKEFAPAQQALQRVNR